MDDRRSSVLRNTNGGMNLHSDATPLDLSMHSKPRKGDFMSCPGSAQTIFTHDTQSVDQQSEIKQQQYSRRHHPSHHHPHHQNHHHHHHHHQQQQQVTQGNSPEGVHDKFTNPSSCFGQPLRLVLSQVSSSVTTGSPSVLSTSVCSLSSGPAESYVIDLEPGRSSNVRSPVQPPRVSSLQHVENNARLLSDFHTPSKLFSSSLLPWAGTKTEPGQSPNVGEDHQQQALPSTVLERADSGIPGQTSEATERASVLPSYSEALALSSISHSNPQQLITPSHVTASQLISPDHVTILHSDEHMDVRFVPYSSLVQISPTGVTDQDLLLHTILQHQREFLQTGQRTASPNQSGTDDHRAAETTQQSLSNAGQSSRDTTLSPQRNVVPMEPSCGRVEAGALDATPSSLPRPSQLQLSNLIGSESVLFAPMNAMEVGQGETPISQPVPADVVPHVTSCGSLPAAYLMAQTAQGKESLGSVLAIPLIGGGAHPSTFTGLQPFAFSTTSIGVSTQNGNRPIMATDTQGQQMGSGGRQEASPSQAVELTVSDVSTKLTSTNISLTQKRCEDNSLNREERTTPPSDPYGGSSEGVGGKPKAGRLRSRGGRGGRAGVKGSASKEMKLLTENTLFPGVYTSILKLPWSRRSRNKVKAKTVSQMRKEAQAIALAKARKKTGNTERDAYNISVTDNVPYTSSGFPSTCDNAAELAIVSSTPVSQGANRHEQIRPKHQSSSFQNHQAEINSHHESNLKFPRIDEVLRQSQALQKVIQENGVHQALAGKNLHKESPLGETCNLGRGQGKQIQTTPLFSLSHNSSPSQAQRPIEDSISGDKASREQHEVDVKIFTDTSPPVGNQIQDVEFNNVVMCSSSSSPSSSALVMYNTSSSPSFSASVLCNQSHGVINEFEKPDATETLSEVKASVARSNKPHRRRGRPPKSTRFIVPDVKPTDSAKHVVPDQMVNRALTVTSSTSLLTGGHVFDTSNPDTTTFTVIPQSRDMQETYCLDTEELSLEKKISLLTQKIGLEMSQSLIGLNTQQQNGKTRIGLSAQSGFKGKETASSEGNKLLPARVISPQVAEQNLTSAASGLLNQRLLAGTPGCHASNDPSRDTGPGRSSGYTASAYNNELFQKEMNFSVTDPQTSASESIPTSTQAPVPRRKKVSRLLKSDENFMYATFKIKPKGSLTPRKTRRKRNSTSARAESGVKKKFGENLLACGKDVTVDKSASSTIAWKFHQQYPADGADADGYQGPVTGAFASAACEICGNPCLDQGVSVTGVTSRPKCHRCLRQNGYHQGESNAFDVQNTKQEPEAELIDPTNLPKPLPTMAATETEPVDVSLFSARYLTSSMATPPDLVSVNCMTCGQMFQRFFSDPQGSCDRCLSIAPRVISASKLFSFTDAPSLPESASLSSSLYSSSFSTAGTSLSPASSSCGLSLSSAQTSTALGEHSPPMFMDASPHPNTVFSLADNPGQLDSLHTLAPVLNSVHTLAAGLTSSSSSTSGIPANSSITLSPLPATLKLSLPSSIQSGHGCDLDPVMSRDKLRQVPETSGQRVKVAGNNLYCSLCRMKFAKICDYLSHVRSTHERQRKSPELNTPDSVRAAKVLKGTNLTGSPAVPSKRPARASKTKKSLAHKTLTCPVEDCPQFFRERKEIDGHFLRKHPDLQMCPFHGCSFTSGSADSLSAHISSHHGKSSGPTETIEAIVEQTLVREVESFDNDLVSPIFDSNGATSVHQSMVRDGHALLESASGDHSPGGEGNSFQDNGLVTSHSQLNSDVRAQNESINNSMVLLGQSASEKPLQCELCDYRCRQKNALNWHMRKHPEAAGQYRKYSVIAE